ncbi:hypothetical protein MIR68_002497 [Amoeboaphelidium protococcarum]|nr:hypothetical protein MIR68_002497 [Amoeboaphelidium protococcarum]
MTRSSKRLKNKSLLVSGVKKQKLGYETSWKLFVCQVLPLVIRHQSDIVNNNGIKRGDNVLILLLKWKNDNCWLSQKIASNLISMYSSLNFINDFATLNNAIRFCQVYRKQVSKSAFDVMTGQLNGKSLCDLLMLIDVKSVRVCIQKLGYDPSVSIDDEQVKKLIVKFAAIRQTPQYQGIDATTLTEMEAFVYVYDHFVQSAVESNVNLSVQSILLDIVYNGSCAGRSEDLQLALIKLWLLPIIRYECKVRGDCVRALVDSVWEIVRDELMAVKDQLTLKNSVNKVVYDCIRHAVTCSKAWTNQVDGH